MSETKLIDFNQSINKTISSYNSNVKFVNCYAVPSESGRAESVLVTAYGSKLLKSVYPDNGVGCRGVFESSTGAESTGYKSTKYYVYGDTVFRYNRAGNFIKVGNVSLTNNLCSFAENQDQSLDKVYVYVCDGITIYKFLANSEDDIVASTYAEIPNLPFVNGSTTEYAIPNYITYSDYRLFFSTTNSNQWYHSGINNDTFTQTAFYTTESSADKTKRIVQGAGALWTFGERSFEQWVKSGNANKPYSANKPSQGFIGLHAPDSIALIDDKMVWLGENQRIYMAQSGNAPVKVSDKSIEELISKFVYTEFAKGFTFKEHGCDLYAITFEQSDVTLVYNITTSKWHSRSSSINGREKAWDIAFYSVGYDGESDVMGSINSNVLVATDRTIAVDWEDKPITRVYQSPVYIDNLNSFRLKSIRFDVETGIGGSYTVEPKVYIKISWDAGKTFGETIERPLGYAGQYSRIVEVKGLGRGKDLVINIFTADPIPLNIYQMKIDVQGGTK